ncbi:alpha/beta hydrolase [Nonomuraea roseoviolacea]|uniref:Pimeloyl-ACP methyl ester carboxylesterase n=1 Tax=Nonomuraea roseoviolacea subsp. carminata TaxID=160689 RepID=A0ABT1KG18_9ACTN|nr:alpha/beta hydrolase [Nonomuraea roseoviolacea]MCP2352931.1 pimeloyl-ACP methyl ester carboxylesterase [Nonomuraea roseoviolacea subsp. carminata]
MNKTPLLIVTGVAVFGTLASPPPPAAATLEPRRTGALARFEQQEIVWHGCRKGPDDAAGRRLDAARARCAEITVPLDYARPDGRTIKVAMSRLEATAPGRRRGVLLINPGGPGVPGLSQVLIGSAMPEVAARYDLIGMDPRFVGRSGGASVGCRWDTGTFVRSAGPSRATFDEGVTAMRRLAAGCAGSDHGMLPHASTRNTARDMDLIRAALGAPKLSYLGVSYGTYLGAVYLRMFPGRADRFVLDSAVDPDAYGPGLLRPAGPAMEAALRAWAAWAATRHDRLRLGATAGRVLATVDRIARAAGRRPLRVGPHRVGASVLPYVLAARLADDGEEAYASLAADVALLRQAARGARVTPAASLDLLLTDALTGAGEGFDRAGTPVLCADRAASRDPGTYFRDIEAHRADEPLFGPMTRNISPCAFWPTAPAEPPTDVRTDAPALIVGAAGDPWTPHTGQRAMRRALSGSRMITLRGAYRHGVFLAAGAPCVDTAVTRYLSGGVLPAADTTCTRNGAGG